MASNWPLNASDLRKALALTEEQEDDDELTLFVEAACSIIDEHTGRTKDPRRHVRPDGKLPPQFVLAGREQAKHMWNQTKNGPRSRPDEGAPMGIGILAKVAVWLEPFPAPPGFGGRG